MASIGRIAGSLASVTNENTFALVNINLDFSLVRCEPISEFLPVGSALTKRRMDEAELGQTHKTARVLGFLFNDIIPDTPELRKAYGRRVSDILSRPDINPQGTVDDGPFRPFIGADGTSIWAAATSGDASISVLLLAFMLANSFDAKNAVSVWFELIEERKRAIQAQAESGKMMNPHTVLAAQQGVSRSDLRIWDASARSWIRRADVSMSRRKTQFALIVDNLTIPYPGGETLSDRVMATWTRAMGVMKNLLNNNPQQACDRAIIAGISAWHLYPDLLVFQEDATKVPFDDPILPSLGVLSLGLEYKAAPSDNFIRWSLALSHLRYYGDPVKVRSGETLRRITLSELWLAALGAILHNWQVPYTGIYSCMEWFIELGYKLASSSGSQCVELSWLVQLCSSVTDATRNGKDIAVKLVKYGYRRGTKFLCGSGKVGSQTPFFGLCNPATLCALAQVDEVEVGIEYLRQIACSIGLAPDEAVISYENESNGQKYTEWATISPIEGHMARRTPGLMLGEGPSKSHARWIHYHSDQYTPSAKEKLHERVQCIHKLGELCDVAEQEPIEQSNIYSWQNAPVIFKDWGIPTFRQVENLNVRSRRYDLWIKLSKYEHDWDEKIKLAVEQLVPIDQGLVKLKNIRSSNWISDHFLKYLCASRSLKGLYASKKRKRSASNLRAHNPPTTIYDEKGDCFNLMTHHITRSTEFIMSLRALEVANLLYMRLPGVTVSSRIIEKGITKASWLPDSMKEILRMCNREDPAAFSLAVETAVGDHFKAMTREDSFSCVAMFESGHADIDPKQLTEVIALCHEDSIFVSEILMSDPSIEVSTLGLRHLVGNVGHAGMVLMVSPLEPRLRSLEHDASLVEHLSYDYKRIDNFKGTSMHLSFTTWKMPLDYAYTGEIDQEIFLLESVISIQQNGRWVADIDVLGREKESPDILTFNCSCQLNELVSGLDAVSLDTWDELLDTPPCVGVFRANANWVARLAAISIIIQKGQGHIAAIIDGERICLSCLRDIYNEPEPHFPQLVIY